MSRNGNQAQRAARKPEAACAYDEVRTTSSRRLGFGVLCSIDEASGLEDHAGVPWHGMHARFTAVCWGCDLILTLELEVKSKVLPVFGATEYSSSAIIFQVHCIKYMSVYKMHTSPTSSLDIL